MDMLHHDFPPLGSSVSLLTSGLLSPGRVQPVGDESSVVRRPSSPSVFIPAVDSPVASPLVPPILNVGSSPVVSLSGRASPCSLLPDSAVGWVFL